MQAKSPPARPQYRNIHVTQLASYRLPVAGWVSILHRISGVLLFLGLPLLLWLFEYSATSRTAQQMLREMMQQIWFKLIVLALAWAYLHHFCAGLRHLWMDAFHTLSKEQGAQTSMIVLLLSGALTALVAAKLFGVM